MLISPHVRDGAPEWWVQYFHTAHEVLDLNTHSLTSPLPHTALREHLTPAQSWAQAAFHQAHCSEAPGTFPARCCRVNPVSPQGTPQPSGAGFCPVFLLPFQKPELLQSRGMEPMVLTSPPCRWSLKHLPFRTTALCCFPPSQHHQYVMAGARCCSEHCSLPSLLLPSQGQSSAMCMWLRGLQAAGSCWGQHWEAIEKAPTF